MAQLLPVSVRSDAYLHQSNAYLHRSDVYRQRSGVYQSNAYLHQVWICAASQVSIRISQGRTSVVQVSTCVRQVHVVYYAVNINILLVPTAEVLAGNSTAITGVLQVTSGRGMLELIHIAAVGKIIATTCTFLI